MSKADILFRDMCNDILQNGYSTATNNEKVRPVWNDGSPAHTTKKFFHCNEYDLREEFPLLTLRPTAFKYAVDEILWIYQKKSNKTSELMSRIWDSWADENSVIGKAYGYQVGVKNVYPQGAMDQMDNVLWMLKNKPYDRAIMIELFNHKDLHEMRLRPCVHLVVFNAIGDTLHMQIQQRSADVFVANNWNVVQYAALLMMVSQCTGFKPGKLIHTITDCHIYDLHIPLVEEMLKREPRNAPKVYLDYTVEDFYKFTPNSFIVEDYDPHPQYVNIPVAI